MYTISQLFIYPVKSLGGIEVTQAHLTDRGLQYDRRWMLVDNNNHFLTQREYPVMCLLQTAIEGNKLLIYHKDNPDDKVYVLLQPIPTNTTIQVQVWEDECTAQFVSDEADEWFSNKLSMPCRMVFMPENVKRKVDHRYAIDEDITSFSDGYPLLMIGQASLDDLNRRLEELLPMDRFRPSIVFAGGQPYDEDTMSHIRINEIDLYGVKLCARCVVTTINQTNSIKAKEPLRTLADYRMKNNKIHFGQNVLLQQTGYLKTGDVIKVIQTKQGLFDTK